MSVPGDVDPWTRLKGKFKGLLDPIDPRTTPSETPDELKQWMFNTSAVITICMACSGAQQLSQLSSEPVAVPKHLPPALHDLYVRNQQSGRIAKIASRALTAGWHALMFGGLFFGLDGLATAAVDQGDKRHTAAGGLLTGGLYGGLLPGTLVFKASRLGLGAAVGGLAGLFVGWLHHDIVPALEASPAGDSKSN